MKKDNYSSPIILLGAQRSGTTALAYALSNAFNNNGGMFTVNGKLMYLLQRWLTNEDISFCHLRVDEILHALKRRMPGGVDVSLWLADVEDNLRQAAIEVANGRYKDSYELAKVLINNSYAKYPIWGDKYNEYLHQIPYINQLYPEAKYILLIRNPYDISKSLLEWSGDRPWKPTDEQSNLKKWERWHKPWIKYAKTWSRDKYLIIEYQKLCSGDETKRLSEFLNINLNGFLDNLKPKRKNEYSNNPLPFSINETWEELIKLKEYCNGDE